MLSSRQQHYEPTYRFLQGQSLHLHSLTDTQVELRAWVRVKYDDGSDALLTVPEIPQGQGGERAIEDLPSLDVATQDGWVVGAAVEMLTAGIKRGQTYVRLQMEPFGCILLQDYCFTSFGEVALGTHIQPGPGGGAGHLFVQELKAFGTATSRIVHQFVISNMVRKILGYSVFLECSGVAANRNMSVQLREALGSGGTIPDGRKSFWDEPGITLTADQDGNLYADSELSSHNDDGVRVYDSPTPFPLWITEDMNTEEEIDFEFTSLDAGDNNSVYLFVEEWLVP